MTLFEAVLGSDGTMTTEETCVQKEAKKVQVMTVWSAT